MPQKNKRARHARAQRKDGESKFTTLFQNTTSADYAIDPDYIPSDSEADSDCSDLCEGWAFSMADNNDSEQCGVSDKILKKRKRDGEVGEAAQTIVGHESDVEESGEETDLEVVECTKARDSAKLFWANALDGVSKKSSWNSWTCLTDLLQKKSSTSQYESTMKLKAMPTYSGAGRSSMFAKKAVLKKVVRGSAKIDTLFAVIPKNRTSEAVAAAAAAANAGEDGDESDDEDLVHETIVGTCCMQKLMSLQKDFFTKKPLLQKVIEEAGHKCYFLPKFHCELNPIEMYWGWVKIREFMHLCL